MPSKSGRFQCPKGHWLDAQVVGQEGTFECPECNTPAYAALVSKPLVEALQDLYDGVNNEKFPPDARKRVWNELGKAEAALEQWKGGRG